MISLARQTITYGLVLATVVYLSIAILGRSAQSAGEQVNYTSAIPEAPAKPYLFAEEAAEPEAIFKEPSEETQAQVADVIDDKPVQAEVEQAVAFEFTLPTAANKPSKAQIDQVTSAIQANAAKTSEPEPAQALAPDQDPASAGESNNPAAAKPKSAETAPSLTALAAVTAKPAHQPTPTPKRGWSVRIGAFADQQSASTLIRDLRDLGYAVFSQKAKDAGNRRALTVVFVGPEQSRAEAEDLRVELQVMETLDGKVVYVK